MKQSSRQFAALKEVMHRSLPQQVLVFFRVMDFILRTFLEFLNWTDKARCMKYIDHVLVHKRNAKWVAFLHINMAEVEITNWTSSTHQMELI